MFMFDHDTLFLIIYLSTFLVSVFWLLDSIISVILLFTIFVITLIFILFILGSEFVPITLSIMYLGGVLILFMFIVFTLGNEYNYDLENRGFISKKKIFNVLHNNIDTSPILILFIFKLHLFTNFFNSVLSYIVLLIVSNSIDDDNILYSTIAESEDIGIFNNFLYTEFSFGVFLAAWVLYLVLIGCVSIIDNNQRNYKYI